MPLLPRFQEGCRIPAQCQHTLTEGVSSHLRQSVLGRARWRRGHNQPDEQQWRVKVSVDPRYPCSGAQIQNCWLDSQSFWNIQISCMFGRVQWLWEYLACIWLGWINFDWAQLSWEVTTQRLRNAAESSLARPPKPRGEDHPGVQWRHEWQRRAEREAVRLSAQKYA